MKRKASMESDSTPNQAAVKRSSTNNSWASSGLRALGSLVSSWRSLPRTTAKRFIQTTYDGFSVTNESRRYEYDIGEREEAFFPSPEGPVFQYEEDLSQFTDETIRLLEILKGDRSDQLVCRVHIVPLADHPPYEALSYYWGSDEAAYSIGVQTKHEFSDQNSKDEDSLPKFDTIFRLQANIRAALRHVRLPDRSRLVWADALCINQSDLNERNYQVALMHKIYSKAERTLIWIGKAAFGSDRVFKALRKVASDDKSGAIPDSPDKSVFGESQLSGGPAVMRLIGRDWFHRLWTVQEVLLAKDAEIFCGWEQMPWSDFVRAIHILYQRDLAPGRRLSLLDQGRFDPFLVLTSGGLEMSRETNKDPYQRLTNLLLALRPRDSTDPSDKVYGLSGLICGPDGKQILTTNYHKSYDEVYAMATRLVLEKTQTLDILGASGSDHLLNSEGEPVPSWVGDFVHRSRPPRPFRFTHEAAIRIGREDLQTSSKSVRFNGDELLLHGCFVDEIAQVAPVLRDFDLTEVKRRIDEGSAQAEKIEQEMRDALSTADSLEEPKSFVSTLKTKVTNVRDGLKVANAIGSANSEANTIEIRTMFSWYLRSVQTFLDWEHLAGVKAVMPDVEEIKESDDDYAATVSFLRRSEYWRTIAGGNLLSDNIESSRSSFERFYDMLTVTRNLRQQGVANKNKSDKLLNLAGYLAGQYSAGTEFPKLLAHAQGRRLAKTVKDNLVLVAENAKPGDRVAFCKGARVPFILREQRQQKAWTFVGEAYSYAFVDADLSKEEWRTINIW